MDDPGVPRCTISLVVCCYCAYHAVFNKVVPVVTVHYIDMPQAQSLSTAGWLATRHMHQQYRSLQETVDPRAITLDCFWLQVGCMIVLSMQKNSFWSHSGFRTRSSSHLSRTGSVPCVLWGWLRKFQFLLFSAGLSTTRCIQNLMSISSGFSLGCKSDKSLS